MARAEIDGSVAKAVAEVKSGSKQWALFGYAPKSDSKIQLVETGAGDFDELSENWNDGKVLYAFVKFTVNNLSKYAYIAWCGEGVAGMKKGNFNTHANEVGKVLQGFHVQINARNEDDLKVQDIIAKLGKAGGASYDAGAKNQGTASPGIRSVAEGRQAASQSNASKVVADKSDYNKKQESEQFWNKVNSEQQAPKAQQPAVGSAGDYAKTSEREAFWKKQQEEEATAKAAAAAKPKPVVTGGNVAARFNPQPAAAAPKPAPAPPKPVSVPKPAPAGTPPAPAKPAAAAPPPPAKPSLPAKAAAPPPPPEPEPEPQPEEAAWEEPAPAEPAYEAPAEDAAAYDQAAYEQQPDAAAAEYYGEQEQPAADGYDASQGQQYDEQAQGYDQQYAEQQYAEQGYDQQYAEQPAYTEEQQPEQYAGDATGAVQCRSLYAYEAQNESDLSFPENVYITVLDQSDPGGWWKGSYEGQEGYFPMNFVELV